MKKEVELEIDLWDLTLHMIRKYKSILLVALLCAGLALAVSRMLPPQYTASTRIYVLNREQGIHRIH